MTRAKSPTAAADPAPTRTFSASRVGAFLAFPEAPGLGEHLEQLCVGRVEPRPGAGSQAARGPVYLYGLDVTRGELRALVCAGLESPVRGLFKAAGVEFRVAGDRPALPAPDALRLAGLPDPAVARFAARAGGGLVRYDDTRVDVCLLAAGTCLAFLGVKTIIVARTRADAKRVTSLLRASGVGAALSTGAGRDEPKRVTVCTLGATGMVDFARANLVLVLDALHATWSDPAAEPPPALEDVIGRCGPPTGLLDRLKDCEHAVVVGFLPRNRVLSPFEQARAWQAYGFAVLTVPRHGAVERPVMVAAHRVALGKAGVGKGDLAAKKALWHDRVRNRRLARVARALAAGDSATLAADFPAVADAIDGPGAKSVLVLAEGLDQAEELAAQLKGWPLVSGLDEYDAARPFQGARSVVATALGLRRLAGSSFDAVVRADPGRGLPPLPPGWLDSEDPDPRPLVLIDADDSGRPLPALWSRSHRRAYLEAGWTRAGRDPDLESWSRLQTLLSNQEGDS